MYQEGVIHVSVHAHEHLLIEPLKRSTVATDSSSIRPTTEIPVPNGNRFLNAASSS